ncbi:hypothetical protein M4I32_02645 [Microbacterium sp. LRZ72]|uniref:hypothetical protein n=1 Tax=Microbacterium sp. LRZ72 TaxID=2942481 RepID=UPI0029AC80E8|nr:hypothetical protein [Microbacterium sp. LRZ72]MDX2375692.1 hypothetical protein [Microbacterium sp. LRZ72]
MILAGLVLLAVGALDLLRQLPLPWARAVAISTAGVALCVVGGLADALPPALVAVVLAAGWMWLMPRGAPARAGVWPALAVFFVAGVAVAAIPARAAAGLIGDVWSLASPVGEVSFDQAVLVAGGVVFLTESANVVVRAALGADEVSPRRIAPARRSSAQGVGDRPSDAPPAEGRAAGDAPDPSDEVSAQEASVQDESDAVVVPLGRPPALKGGRLIGPLERILVLALTLAAAYALLAAALAAKGIVRFPEISRDDGGDRAEYFLVGSLVSWVLALGVAVLVWWTFAVGS